MSIKRRLIRSLDRPGGRALLRRATTTYARWRTGADVEILFEDGYWSHRVGAHRFPDDASFGYYANVFDSWPTFADECLRNARDYWFWRYAPAAGDCIIDIGAGRGEDVLLFSTSVGETGRVLAIEAHPRSFRALDRFCRLNRLTNVVALNLAVADRPGSVFLTESEAWVENSVTDAQDESAVPVPAASLDDVCASQAIDRIDFLKINIEGAETQALSGMGRSIDYVDRICVACHDFRANRGHAETFRTRAFVEGFLQDHGFLLFSRPTDARDYVRDHVHGERRRLV